MDYGPFEVLNTLLAETSDKFETIVCGDFNSRTDTKNDLLLCESIPGLELEESHDDCTIHPRNNKDTNTNSYLGRSTSGSRARSEQPSACEPEVDLAKQLHILIHGLNSSY